MDEGAKSKILRSLSDIAEDAQITIILTIQKPEEDRGPQPDPTAFNSQAEYRQALIDKRLKDGETLLRPVLERLQKIGLRTKPAYQSGVIVAEGTALQIDKALSLPEVESAALDAALEVISSHPS